MPDTPHQWADSNKRGSGANLSPDTIYAMVGDDEEIKKRVKLLVTMSLENAIRTMAQGTLQDRMAISRSLLPPILKAMTVRGNDQEDLRAMMLTMFQEMIGTDAPTLPSSGPPPPPPAISQ